MDKNSLSNDLLKGAKAASLYLGIDPRSVYTMVANGTLPCIRKNKLIFFRKSELDNAFSSGEAS